MATKKENLAVVDDGGFDLSSAVPVDEDEFDLSSAVPVDENNLQLDLGSPLIRSGADNWSPIPKASSIGSRILSAITPETKDIPELVGSTALDVGAKIANANPLVAPIISGVGAAGGEAYHQIAQRAGLMEGAPPETSGEALKRMGGAFARGAGSTVAGAAVGKVASKVAPYITEPFKASYTDLIKYQKALAEKMGIKVPLKYLSDSPFVQGMARTSEFALFGKGQEVVKEIKTAQKAFEDFAEETLTNMGKQEPPEKIIEMAGNKFKFFENSLNDLKDKLYTAAYKLMPENKVEPDLSRTIETINSVIKDRTGEFEPAMLNRLKKILKDIKGGEVIKKDLGVLDQFGNKIIDETKTLSSVENYNRLRISRRNLGDLIQEGFNDPALSGVKNDLGRIYAAMSQDLDSTASKISPAFAEAIKNADTVFENGMNKLKQTYYNSFEKKARENPTTLYQSVFNPRQPDALRFAKQIFGPEEMEQMQMQWLSDILDNSKITRDGYNDLSPVKMASNILKYEKILPEMFPDKEMLQEITNLKDIGLLFSRGSGVTSNSPSAFLLGMFNILRGFGLSNLAASDIGKQWLTSGIPVGDFIKKQLEPSVKLATQNLLQKRENKKNDTRREVDAILNR